MTTEDRAMEIFNKMTTTAYRVPATITINTGAEPTDIRNTCDYTEDWDTLAVMGLDVRYDGLITYEISSKKWKGCIANDAGGFDWVDITGAVGGDGTLDKDALIALLSDTFAEKDHTHEELLAVLSDDEPQDRPIGHIWLDPVD